MFQRNLGTEILKGTSTQCLNKSVASSVEFYFEKWHAERGVPINSDDSFKFQQSCGERSAPVTNTKHTHTHNNMRLLGLHVLLGSTSTQVTDNQSN